MVLDDNGDDHPASYYSQKLLPREERYATVEKECLAIRLAVQAFGISTWSSLHNPDRPLGAGVARPPQRQKQPFDTVEFVLTAIPVLSAVP